MQLRDLPGGTRLLLGVPRLLRRPITPSEARAVLDRRLRERDSDLLAAVRRIVGPGAAGGPYPWLFRTAGAEYGDVERLVRREGLEGALQALAGAGVYLTVEELKGRRPLVRGGVTFAGEPRGRPRAAPPHIVARTSGSRGDRTSVPIGLAAIRDWAVDACLDFEARGGLDWVHGRWTVPGGDSLVFLLLFCAFGAAPARWFSPVDPAAAGLPLRYRWSARLLRWTARSAGRPFPPPEHVPLDDPTPVAAWLAAVRRAGRTPHLVTYVSSAVRVCEAALRLGLDIAGARFSVTGEPITEARLAAIRQAGAAAAPYYGSVEAGLIGAGCLAPAAPDDVHVHHDLVTLVHPDPRDAGAGLRPDTLLVSAVRDTAPVRLLNVSLGDVGRLEARRCGCPLERLGWTWHLRHIRSFEKLTAAGMTFLDVDVIRALEEVLPARFGGGPTDYQLVEDEAPGGGPRLRLLVHPRVGPVSQEQVAAALLEAIGRPEGAAGVMARHWRGAGILRVVRGRPLPTPSGKVLHLHRSAPGRNGTDSDA